MGLKENLKALYYVSECPDTGREFLVQSGKDGNIVELTSDNVYAMGLLGFLQEQYSEYKQNILPFYAVNEDMADTAKNEFLESLWDVISQHFADAAESPITGTCDICSQDKAIDVTILCNECQQTNQICSDCVTLEYLYCRDCNSVLETE